MEKRESYHIICEVLIKRRVLTIQGIRCTEKYSKVN